VTVRDLSGRSPGEGSQKKRREQTHSPPSVLRNDMSSLADHNLSLDAKLLSEVYSGSQIVSTHPQIQFMNACSSLFRRLIICGASVICCFASTVSASQINVVIQPSDGSPGRALIEILSEPTRAWSFPNSYAGVSELGSRVRNPLAFDTAGSEIPLRTIAPGHFEAAQPATKFRYEVDLSPPARPSDAARVSWLIEARGLLMLADLLPTNLSEEGKGVAKGKPADDLVVRFTLPASWRVASNENQDKPGIFHVRDAARSVFAIGLRLRDLQMSGSGMGLRLVTDGDWAFSDGEVIKMAVDVIKMQRDIFGSAPTNGAMLILIPFPQPVGSDRWSAETRGRTVTLLMGRLPSKIGALGQLSTPLTHELFHLWVPNGLDLSGDYDWFYEGFTIYQAVRTAVRLDRLTFAEMLNAIARAYDGYVRGAERDRWSLIEASKRRWTTGETSVYSKAMVIAFLYDLSVRHQSKGKLSLDDVYRKIFRDHRFLNHEAGSQAGRKDGNAAAVAALSGQINDPNFVRRFITEPVTLDLQKELAQFGLQVETIGIRTRINVAGNLTGKQRDLLRQLGYNERGH
jgi:hypothetical protein